MSSTLVGPLRFIRYAFMPNRLQYCGGDDNATLFGYAAEGRVDAGLPPLLGKFIGALPYLRLIAEANDIADPFDERVVEAYWLGNELLEQVEVRQLHDALLARFGGQLQGRTRHWVLAKAPAGARPHHSFHVLDVHRHVGELESTLATMDACRISWGQVRQVRPGELLVERQPLVLRCGKLDLGPPQVESVLAAAWGHTLLGDAAPGAWVSIHWGWACEVLAPPQLSSLRHYTLLHLGLASQTL